MSKRQTTCPRCGAMNVGIQDHCLLCQARLPDASQTAFAQPRTADATRRAGGVPAACLVRVSGGGPPRVDLPPGGLTIGRSSSSGLVLRDDPLVSRQHARLDWTGGEWVLNDLDARNGTFVNGARVTRQALRPGDQIGIGQAVWVFQGA
jgi:hypothetical protein